MELLKIIIDVVGLLIAWLSAQLPYPWNWLIGIVILVVVISVIVSIRGKKQPSRSESNPENFTVKTISTPDDDLGSFRFGVVSNQYPRLVLDSYPSEGKPICAIAREGCVYLGQSPSPERLYQQLSQYGKVDRNRQKLVAIPEQSGSCDVLQARILSYGDKDEFWLVHGGESYKPDHCLTYLNGELLISGASERLTHSSAIRFHLADQKDVRLIFLMPEMPGEPSSPLDNHVLVMLKRQKLWEDVGKAYVKTGLPHDAALAYELAIETETTAEKKYELWLKAGEQWQIALNNEKSDSSRWQALQCRGGPLLSIKLQSINLKEKESGDIEVLVSNNSIQEARNITLTIGHRSLLGGHIREPFLPFHLKPNSANIVKFKDIVITTGEWVKITFGLHFQNVYDPERKFDFYAEYPISVRTEPQVAPIIIQGSISYAANGGLSIQRSLTPNPPTSVICPNCDNIMTEIDPPVFCTSCGKRL